MPIVQAGQLNTTNLIVPNLYIQIKPPQTLLLNGVASNIVGIVGTAPWGPINTPMILASMADYDRVFGGLRNRLFDAGTLMATAAMQGAADFRVVRVTDGTDVKATATIDAGEFEALYSGSAGNSIQVSISAGARANTWRAVVTLPGLLPEVYENLPQADFWMALQQAINVGQGLQRGASQLVRFSVLDPLEAVVAATYALTGGTDGSSVVSADMLGIDADRTGMYALRGQGCSSLALADVVDASTWTEQASFGASEGIYVVLAGTPGETIQEAITRKRTAGLDDTNAHLMFGDWLWWNDPVSRLQRLVSPQGPILGMFGTLSPEQSSLNKPMVGIIGSQKTGKISENSSLTYSDAELSALFRAGIDVITNPLPFGSVWGVRGGFNSSTRADVNGDNHPRMVNYIARTLNAGMGRYVGRLLNPATVFVDIRVTLNAFLQSLREQGMIEDYSVKCDDQNNPPDRRALNYVQADVRVRLFGIVKNFIVNLEAGQSVTVVVE